MPTQTESSSGQPTQKKQLHPLISMLMLAVVISIGIGMMKSGTETKPVPVITNTPVAESFDVPALLGKNIDEITTVLGTPAYGVEPTAEQLRLGSTTEWEKSWKKGELELLVTYNLKTKEVVDFFLSTTDPTGMTKDIDALLASANAKEGQTAYSALVIKALKDPKSYTGIKIVPR